MILIFKSKMKKTRILDQGTIKYLMQSTSYLLIMGVQWPEKSISNQTACRYENYSFVFLKQSW